MSMSLFSSFFSFKDFGTNVVKKLVIISEIDITKNNVNFPNDNGSFVALQANKFEPKIGPTVRDRALIDCETPLVLDLISEATELLIIINTLAIAVTIVQIEIPIFINTYIQIAT